MMKKTFLFLTLFMAILFLAGCTNEILNENEPASDKPETQMLSLIAAIPGSNTRLALIKDTDGVKLAWEAGDKLQFLFSKEGVNKISEVTLEEGDITVDGKTATFTISVPGDISLPYDLYGTYGGTLGENGLLALPGNTGNGSLDEVKVALVSEKVTVESENIGKLNFTHIGSLFQIKLKNNASASLTGIEHIRIFSVESGWAYNSTGGNTYNVVDGTFSNPAGGGNSLSLIAAETALATEGELSFWGWYPIPPGIDWPALSLELTHSGGTSVSTNSTPARTGGLSTGKNYTFNAIWDNGDALAWQSSYVYVPEILSVTETGTVDILVQEENYIKFKVREHATETTELNPHKTDPTLWVYFSRALPPDATLVSLEYKSDVDLKRGGSWYNNGAPDQPIYDRFEVYLGPFSFFNWEKFPNAWAPDAATPATSEWREITIDISTRRSENPTWGQAGHGVRIDPGNYTIGTTFEFRNIQVKIP